MADLYNRPKMPKRPQARKMPKQRTDFKRKRDESGRFSSTEKSVGNRRFIRALKRKSETRQNRKTSKTIYNERGGLKSQKAMRSAKKRKTRGG